MIWRIPTGYKAFTNMMIFLTSLQQGSSWLTVSPINFDRLRLHHVVIYNLGSVLPTYDVRSLDNKIPTFRGNVVSSTRNDSSRTYRSSNKRPQICLETSGCNYATYTKRILKHVLLKRLLKPREIEFSKPHRLEQKIWRLSVLIFGRILTYWIVHLHVIDLSRTTKSLFEAWAILYT